MLFSLMQQETQTTESSAAPAEAAENTEVQEATSEIAADSAGQQDTDHQQDKDSEAEAHSTEAPAGQQAGDDHTDDGEAAHTGDDDTDHDHTDDDHPEAAHTDHGHGDHGPVDYLSTEELFKHVQDAEEFHFPPTITRYFTDDEDSDLAHGHVVLPQPMAGVLVKPLEFNSPYIKPLDFRLTRFMVVELMAAILVFVIFTAVAQKIKKGGVPKGRLWNLFESMIQFIRRDVGQAVIGKKDGAAHAPFLLTIFFFVLGCNLLGMIPGLGAPTGDFVVTATLASVVFIWVVVAGMKKFGFGGFFANLVPSMDLPPAMKVVLVPMIFVIEVIGFLIKHFVLAVRLFANMMAGHLVLAAIVAFIGVTHQYWFGNIVKPASVMGATALSILEVFVAFLQAYIFTFLSALFISSATHHH